MEQFNPELKMKKLFALLSIMSALFVMSASAEEMNATAKAECTKLDNTYLSIKRDYNATRKAIDARNFADDKSETKYVQARKTQKSLESKLTALPATTPEAKLLQKKLLKQLQLGRELTKDELAALEKK